MAVQATRTILSPSCQHRLNRPTRGRHLRSKQESETTSSSYEDGNSSIGVVESSDAAYVDKFLSPVGGNGSMDLSQVFLFSSSKFSKERHGEGANAGKITFLITFHHVLRYRGDIVWQLLTTCSGDSEGMQGTRSTCHLTEAVLRVRLCHKRRVNSCGTSVSTTLNSRERYDLDLNDLLHLSALEYQSQALAK